MKKLEKELNKSIKHNKEQCQAFGFVTSSNIRLKLETQYARQAVRIENVDKSTILAGKVFSSTQAVSCSKLVQITAKMKSKILF
ncbi:hypothetical protein K1719_015933 [Acacia pycnantha]|nr:hypothetical protein K1719_015933 [Acacia pycnantha]